jgi:ABC-type uncharacterized transport system substrate-binding protein
MRESRSYGSVRGARGEARVPTATGVVADEFRCGWPIPEVASCPSWVRKCTPVNVRNAAEIEHSIAEIVRPTNTGLIVTASALALVQRDLILKLVAKHKVPVVYFQREFVDNGGLISYGSNWVDQYRRAATYVDRILKGEKPANLPVQAPTKYELIINFKIAKAMGLTLPPTLLARADEVIE